MSETLMRLPDSVLITSVRRGMTDREISHQSGVSVSTVGRRRRALGMAPGRVVTVCQRAFSDDDLTRCIVIDRITDEQAAEKLGVNVNTLASHRRRIGLPVNEKTRMPVAAEAVERCHAAGMSDRAGAAQLGCAVVTFAARRKELGLSPNDPDDFRDRRAALCSLPAVKLAPQLQRAVSMAFALKPRDPQVLRLLEPHLAAEMARTA